MDGIDNVFVYQLPLMLTFCFLDVKGRIKELAKAGQIVADQDKKYPRVVKIRKFGMHVDAHCLPLRLAWKTWIVDGDEASIITIRT